MRTRKILCLSDYGSTGIGESARVPMTHWHEQGHEIWHLALGYNGWPNAIDRKVYPWYERLLPQSDYSDHAKFGQQSIAKALAISQAEIVFTSYDVWMVNYLTNPENSPVLTEETKQILSHRNRTFRHLGYFPMDGAVENKYLAIGLDEAICSIDSPVTYSRYSKEVIRRTTSLDIPFIPIPHDPAIYKPGDKFEARKKLSLPLDRFIVTMIGTNQYRKGWAEFFEMVAPFAKKHPDVAVLPFTTWGTKIAGGAEIPDLIWRSGIETQVINPDAMVGTLNDEGMAALYQASDVLVLCTIGEGAGLPPIRARACQVPTLVTSHTSNTEFCGSDFEAVPISGKFYDPFGSNLERYTTDTAEMRKRLEKYYTDPAFAAKIAKAGLRSVKQYEIANVMPQWDSILENIS